MLKLTESPKQYGGHPMKFLLAPNPQKLELDFNTDSRIVDFATG